MGAFLMSIVNNSLNMLGVDVYWQNLITGLILILAVITDVLAQKRREELATKQNLANL